jgi:glutamine amidotransferase
MEAKIVRKIPANVRIDALIMPGVGSFQSASRVLSRMRRRILKLIDDGVPLLGICLGMQLLFKSSEEGPGEGLGILDGTVLKLPSSVKVPQMGWNTIRICKSNHLLDRIDSGSWVYYAHSYYSKTSEAVICAETTYGITFPAVVAIDRVFGTQFHPEKSGAVGERILENFSRICKM